MIDGDRQIHVQVRTEVEHMRGSGHHAMATTTGQREFDLDEYTCTSGGHRVDGGAAQWAVLAGKDDNLV